MEAPVDGNHSFRQFFREPVEALILFNDVDRTDLYARFCGLGIVDRTDLDALEAAGIFEKSALPARKVFFGIVDSGPFDTGTTFSIVKQSPGKNGAFTRRAIYESKCKGGLWVLSPDIQ